MRARDCRRCLIAPWLPGPMRTLAIQIFWRSATCLALIQPLRVEVAIDQVGVNGVGRVRSSSWIGIACGRVYAALPPRESTDPVPLMLTSLVQVLPDARPGHCSRGSRYARRGSGRAGGRLALCAPTPPLLPRVEATRPHRQGPTTLRHREFGPLRGDPSEVHAWCFAKKATAVF